MNDNSIDEIARRFAEDLLRVARENNLQWKDVRSPSFDRSFTTLREQIADWLEANMVQPDEKIILTPVEAGRAA